ncbi:hypothetical protein FS837_004964, partial [Tulasnella sp. UAMH 9824]
REILDGMSEYRIDPTSIETPEGAPSAEGGQATVMFATIDSPGIKANLQYRRLKMLLNPDYKRMVLNLYRVEYTEGAEEVKSVSVLPFAVLIPHAPR